MYKDKNVLLAGGTGMVGISLGKLLLEQGANVRVASLDSEEYAALVLGQDIEFIRADLTNKDECFKVMKQQDYCFNLVCLKGFIGMSDSIVANIFTKMLQYEANLVEAAFKNDVERFLFVSSICAYPQAEIHFEDNIWNGMPKQSDKYTGIAKRVGEVLGEVYQKQYGWDAVRVVRPSNIFGPYDDFNPDSAQVIPALIARLINEGSPLTVWGDGSAVRDFLYVGEVAKWMLVALEKLPANTPVNLGCGCGYTIKELAECIVEVSNKKIELQWDTTKPVGDSARVLSIEKAKKLLGFNLEIDIREGIRKTYNWYIENLEIAKKRKAGSDYAK